MEKSSALKSSTGILLAAMTCLVGVMFWNLGGLPLIGPDEPRYAAVARAMFVSGDYIATRLGDNLWFEKPVLFYWLVAISYPFFGVGEFAARFPSALAALATAGFVGVMVRRTVGPRAGVIAALVLMSCGMWIGFFHAATTDMVLAASIAASVLCGYGATFEEGRVRRWFWLGCAASTGLAMLAKGLVGVLLVIVILGAFWLITRRPMIRSRLELVGGTALFLTVVASWYVPVTLQFGRVFIDEFFINHHFKRFLTHKFEHDQPMYFYSWVVLAGALPWPCFLLPATARLPHLRPRQNEPDALAALGWIWFAAPVLFFSLSSSKLPGYILPAFPGLAIVLSLEIERFFDGERTRPLRAAVAMTAFLLALTGAGATWYLLKKGTPNELALQFFCWAPLIMGLVAAFLWARNQRNLMLLSATVLIASVVLAANVVLFPGMQRSSGLKQLALEIGAQLRPQEDIAYYAINRQYAPVFYNAGRVVFYRNGSVVKGIAQGDKLHLKNVEELRRALREKGEPSLILILPNWRRKEIVENAWFQTQPIGTQRDMVALRVALRRAA